ncbi:hypothetical protein BGZ76_002952, partial [Entomortierella beljakovae]
IRKVHPNPLPKLPVIFSSKNEEKILRLVHHKLSQETIGTLEQEHIMVALSNIVNTDMKDANKVYGKITSRIQDECSIPFYDVNRGLLRTLGTVVEKEGIESLLFEIQIRKAEIVRREKKDGPSFSRKYRDLINVLTITEYLATMIIKKKFEISMTELGSTVHWNYILSILIEDPVYIDLGELACKASQKDIRLNEQLFDSVAYRNSPGSKVDMTVRALENSLGKKTPVEIGCIEHKASRISEKDVAAQALKSHRINASILLDLEEQGYNTNTTFPVYLDIHGMSGVMFAQRRFEDVIGVARIGDSLMLPTNKRGMAEFLKGTTLSMLFSYSDWITEYADNVLRARAKKLAQKGESRTPTQPQRTRYPIIYAPRKLYKKNV